MPDKQLILRELQERERQSAIGRNPGTELDPFLSNSFHGRLNGSFPQGQGKHGISLASSGRRLSAQLHHHPSLFFF